MAHVGHTVGHTIEQYRRARVADGSMTAHTAAQMRRILRAHAAHVPERIGDVRPRHLERWLAGLDVAPGTRRLYVTRLRHFYEWAHARGVCPTNPAAGLRKPRAVELVPRAPSTAEARHLVATLPDARARLIVLLMLQLGLRRAEVATLTLDRIDREAGVLIVKGKGGKERVLPIVREVAAAMDDYLAEFPAFAGDPLVRRYDAPHLPLQPPTVGILVRRYMTDAGIKRAAWDGRSAHALRHRAAQDLVESGAELRDVQEVLGHSSPAVSAIYLRRQRAVGALRERLEGRTYGAA